MTTPHPRTHSHPIAAKAALLILAMSVVTLGGCSSDCRGSQCTQTTGANPSPAKPTSATTTPVE